MKILSFSMQLFIFLLFFTQIGLAAGPSGSVALGSKISTPVGCLRDINIESGFRHYLPAAGDTEGKTGFMAAGNLKIDVLQYHLGQGLICGYGRRAFGGVELALYLGLFPVEADVTLDTVNMNNPGDIVNSTKLGTYLGKAHGIIPFALANPTVGLSATYFGPGLFFERDRLLADKHWSARLPYSGLDLNLGFFYGLKTRSGSRFNYTRLGFSIEGGKQFLHSDDRVNGDLYYASRDYLEVQGRAEQRVLLGGAVSLLIKLSTTYHRRYNPEESDKQKTDYLRSLMEQYDIAEMSWKLENKGTLGIQFTDGNNFTHTFGLKFGHIWVRTMDGRLHRMPASVLIPKGLQERHILAGSAFYSGKF